MEILKQSRPASSAPYSYVLYLLTSSGDLEWLFSWSNYLDALDAFKYHEKSNPTLKFLLVGSECESSNT